MYPTMDNSAWIFFFVVSYKKNGSYIICHDSQHKPLHGIQHNNSENRCIRSECLCQGKQKKVMVCRNYNIRNMIFSNYLATKSDPMELNKRHRHSNCNKTICDAVLYPVHRKS
jgi:hypothetical protein